MCSFIARYLQSPAPSVRSAPGGKSVYWQAKPANPSRDMPVESFYGWALNPDLRPVPGTGEETPDSARRSYVRRERYDYRVDFFGRFWRSRNLGAANRPVPALAGGESRSHEASAEAYIPANDSRAHAVREAGRPRHGRVVGHWTSDREGLPQRRREGGDIGPEASSSPGGDPEPANVRRCAADSRRCVEGDGRPTVRPLNGTKALADRRAREQRGHLD